LAKEHSLQRKGMVTWKYTFDPVMICYFILSMIKIYELC
jgi:hypothetical protein